MSKKILITYKNKTNNVSAWAKELGLSRRTLRNRLKNGSVEKAFETPKIDRSKKYNDTEKLCIRCKKWLKFNSFSKDINGRLGLSNYCRSCTTIISRKSRILTRYGISEDYYNILYKEQNGKCLICGVNRHKLCIDHDHKTKEIRGLLCIKCNAMLGHIETRDIDINKIKNYFNRGKIWPIN